MKKLIALAMIGLFTIIFSMGFNVVIHELGHFAVASSFNYEPEMHFNTPLTNESKTFEIDEAIAYVSYSSVTADIVKEDAYIAFAGPLVNIILGTLFSVMYLLNPKKAGNWALVLLILAITSYVAGFSNLYPNGRSDGAIILEYLRNV